MNPRVVERKPRIRSGGVPSRVPQAAATSTARMISAGRQTASIRPPKPSVIAADCIGPPAGSREWPPGPKASSTMSRPSRTFVRASSRHRTGSSSTRRPSAFARNRSSVSKLQSSSAKPRENRLRRFSREALEAAREIGNAHAADRAREQREASAEELAQRRLMLFDLRSGEPTAPDHHVSARFQSRQTGTTNSSGVARSTSMKIRYRPREARMPARTAPPLPR